MEWRESLLQWVMNNADRGVVVTDDRLQVAAWNRWMTEWSGMRAEDVLGRSILELVGTSCLDWAQETYTEALKGKLSVLSHRFHQYLFPMKRRIVSEDVWMLQNATISPLYHVERVVGTLTVVEDVTDRVLREEEITRQLRFRDMVTRIDQAILLRDFAEALQVMTDELHRFLQCRRVGVFFRKGDRSVLMACSPKGDPPEAFRKAGRDLTGREAVADGGETQGRRLTAVPIQDASGIFGALVVEHESPGAFDAESLRMCETLAGQVSLAWARENLRRHLVDSELRYRTVTEHAAVGVAMVRDGRFLFVNETLARLLGTTPEEIVGRHRVLDFIEDPDRRQTEKIIRKLYEGSLPEARIVVRARRPDGAPLFLQVLARAVSFGGQRVILASVVDVTTTHQKDLEMARLFTAIESAGEGVLVTDPRWHIQYVNPAFEAITGFGRDELLGRSARILQEPGNREAAVLFSQITQALCRGEVWKGLLSGRRKDGKDYEVDCVISPVTDGEGRLTSFVCVERDVTRQRALEREMRTNQKMQALGTLAGGIAHDFNNILAIIVGYAEILRIRSKTFTPEMGEAVERIADAVRRAKDLIQQILTFARQREQELRPLNARYVVKEAVKMLHAVIPSTVAIKEDYRLSSPEDDRIEGDPTQIHQIIINLASNAAHAMRENGGEFCVGMHAVELDEEAARRMGNLSKGRYLCLAVSDTGHGMPPEILERIFEPYFTTKPQGEGTGLGLATVHGIVQGHRGAITVESEVGKGTTFRIYFPITERHKDTILTPRKPEELPRGTGRILVVDDEELVVRSASLLMESLGYQVTGVTDSLKALEMFRQNPYEFDAVFTDQTMPHMTGLKLAAAVKAVRPDIPVVLTTGYLDLVRPQAMREAGVDYLVAKPFDTHDVGLALRQVLKGHQAK